MSAVKPETRTIALSMPAEAWQALDALVAATRALEPAAWTVMRQWQADAPSATGAEMLALEAVGADADQWLAWYVTDAVLRGLEDCEDAHHAEMETARVEAGISIPIPAEVVWRELGLAAEEGVHNDVGD